MLLLEVVRFQWSLPISVSRRVFVWETFRAMLWRIERMLAKMIRQKILTRNPKLCQLKMFQSLLLLRNQLMPPGKDWVTKELLLANPMLLLELVRVRWSLPLSVSRRAIGWAMY
jgi:hypothetical protein